MFLVSALIESLSFSPQGRPILGFFTGKKKKLQSSDGWMFRGLLAVQTTLTRLHRLEVCPGPTAPRLPADLISLQPSGSVRLETVHCFTAAARLPPPNPLIFITSLRQTQLSSDCQDQFSPRPSAFSRLYVGPAGCSPFSSAAVGAGEALMMSPTAFINSIFF